MSTRPLTEEEKRIYERVQERESKNLEFLHYQEETHALLLDKGLRIEAEQKRKKIEDSLANLQEQIQDAEFKYFDAKTKLENGVTIQEVQTVQDPGPETTEQPQEPEA